MKALPAIARELRAQARQPMTYNLRILSVTALLGTTAIYAFSDGFQPGNGGALFSALHLVLFWAIWILVPLSASDCLSREQREDTLGLLFLTPLRAQDIVLAKGLAHGWRALTLWLAALPVLVLPFLVGGLPWQNVVFSCAINFSSIALVLGASLLASSLCRQWHRALVLTMILAIGLVFVLAPALSRRIFFGTLFGGFIPRLAPVGLQMPGPYYPQAYYPRGVLVQTMPGSWQMRMTPSGTTSVVLGGLAGGRRQVLFTAGEATVLSLLVAWGLMLLAARVVQNRWQQQGRSVRAEKMERIFCTPVLFRSLLGRWMRHSLARNPIGWLEQRRWSGRLVTWAWFAVIISVYSAALSDRTFFNQSSAFQRAVGWLLMGSLASSAAGSFRRERESGVLELLLVAPLTTGQIIWGRLRGLWAQFLPAVLTLLGLWLYLASLTYTSASEDLPIIGYFTLAFLTIPVIGLYFSLRCRHYVSAFVLTLAFGLLGPLVAASFWRWGWLWLGLDTIRYGRVAGLFGTAPNPTVIATQLGLALFFAARLQWRLEKRAFPFSRAQV